MGPPLAGHARQTGSSEAPGKTHSSREVRMDPTETRAAFSENEGNGNDSCSFKKANEEEPMD